MFFKHCRDASLYARMERVRTGIIHIVVPCRKYLCPPVVYYGRDWISGFTVVVK